MGEKLPYMCRACDNALQMLKSTFLYSYAAGILPLSHTPPFTGLGKLGDFPRPKQALYFCGLLGGTTARAGTGQVCHVWERMPCTASGLLGIISHHPHWGTSPAIAGHWAN